MTKKMFFKKLLLENFSHLFSNKMTHFTFASCRFFVYILLILQCIAIEPTESKNEKIPVENLYEKTDVFPLVMNLAQAKSFSSQYWKLINTAPNFSYKNKEIAVVLVPTKYKKIIQENFNQDKYQIPKNPAFRYYDPTYKLRYMKGFKKLEDLISGYKDYKLNQIYLKALSEKYPDLVTYYELGKTHTGRVIPAIKITNPNFIEEKPSVLFNSSHHSNELISVEHCYSIIYHLLKYPKKYAHYLDNLVLWFVPIVNPDGSYFFWYKSTAMGRKNGFLFDDQLADDPNRGVDLNRNYPFKWNSGHSSASSSNRNHPFFRGLAPASEPETQAMMFLAETERFLLSLSFHAYATKILFPYTIEGLINPNPDIPKEIAQKMANVSISYHPTKNYEAVKNIYAVDGTDQDYYYFKYGTTALLVESSHKNVPYEYMNKIMKGFLPAWEEFLNSYLDGYKLILKIINEDYEPLECQVFIEEFLYYEGESFTSNPKTGYFFKLFPNNNYYTVKVNCLNYQTEIFKYQPKKDIDVLELVLKRN